MSKANFKTVTCEFSSLEESDFAISKMRNAHLPIVDLDISRNRFAVENDRISSFVVPAYSYNMADGYSNTFSYGSAGGFPPLVAAYSTVEDQLINSDSSRIHRPGESQQAYMKATCRADAVEKLRGVLFNSGAYNINVH